MPLTLMASESIAHEAELRAHSGSRTTYCSIKKPIYFAQKMEGGGARPPWPHPLQGALFLTY